MEREDIERLEREMEALADKEFHERIIIFGKPPVYESYPSVQSEYLSNVKKERDDYRHD